MRRGMTSKTRAAQRCLIARNCAERRGVLIFVLLAYFIAVKLQELLQMYDTTGVWFLLQLEL